MELFKSLKERTKLFNDPFKHFEINQPLAEEAIKEICNAAVQLLVAIAYLAPVILHINFSKALTLFPPVDIHLEL